MPPHHKSRKPSARLGSLDLVPPPGFDFLIENPGAIWRQLTKLNIRLRLCFAKWLLPGLGSARSSSQYASASQNKKSVRRDAFLWRFVPPPGFDFLIENPGEVPRTSLRILVGMSTAAGTSPATVDSCAPTRIRTQNNCFEGSCDIHFTIGAYEHSTGSVRFAKICISSKATAILECEHV